MGLEEESSVIFRTDSNGIKEFFRKGFKGQGAHPLEAVVVARAEEVHELVGVVLGVKVDLIVPVRREK